GGSGGRSEVARRRRGSGEERQARQSRRSAHQRLQLSPPALGMQALRTVDGVDPPETSAARASRRQGVAECAMLPIKAWQAFSIVFHSPPAATTKFASKNPQEEAYGKAQHQRQYPRRGGGGRYPAPVGHP